MRSLQALGRQISQILSNTLTFNQIMRVTSIAITQRLAFPDNYSPWLLNFGLDTFYQDAMRLSHCQPRPGTPLTFSYNYVSPFEFTRAFSSCNLYKQLFSISNDLVIAIIHKAAHIAKVVHDAGDTNFECLYGTMREIRKCVPRRHTLEQSAKLLYMWKHQPQLASRVGIGPTLTLITKGSSVRPRFTKHSWKSTRLRAIRSAASNGTVCGHPWVTTLLRSCRRLISANLML